MNQKLVLTLSASIFCVASIAIIFSKYLAFSETEQAATTTIPVPKLKEISEPRKTVQLVNENFSQAKSINELAKNTNFSNVRLSEASVDSNFFTPECSSYIDTLSKLEIDKINEPSVNAIKPGEYNCNLPKALSAVSQRYINDCKSSLKSETSFLQCKQSLLFVTAKAIDLATSDIDISRTTDLSLLSNKLISAIHVDTIDSDVIGGYKRAAKVADRIFELDPTMPDVNKAGLCAHFAVLVTSDPLPTEREWSHFDKLMEQLKSQDAYDDQVRELEFATALTRKKFEKAAEIIQLAKNSNNEPGVDEYYQAMLSNRQKPITETYKHLQRAVSANPTNARFKETLGLFETAMKTGKKPENPFQIKANYSTPQL
jgi:tetratricopeptide (TPR) repeat protein